jgi:hypothetical protein
MTIIAIIAFLNMVKRRLMRVKIRDVAVGFDCRMGLFTRTLTVDKCNSRHLVRLLVVRVLVSALDQLLLHFLEAKRANKTLLFVCDVDYSHSVWVVDPWLATYA